MPVRPSPRHPRLAATATARAVARAGALAVSLAAACCASAQAQPQPTAPELIDGPSPAIESLGGLSVSRDGDGGVAYLRTVAGVAHVFVSALSGGSFQAPVQLDAGPTFSGPSSQPVIAAGQGGLLLVAFVNDGELYVVDRPATPSPWQAAIPLAAGAADPALSLSPDDDKAYLAFTAQRDGGDEVLVAYYDAGVWSLAQGAINVSDGDDAGTGTGAPAVAAAGDGVGIVAWGESGHVFARRVWATAPSVEYLQLDPGSVGGWSETSAGAPAVSTGGDSSYADVAFEETVASGAQTQTRVLLARLVAEQAQPAVAADGLTMPGSGDAGQPALALDEYGRGFATAALSPSEELFAAPIATDGAPGSAVRVDGGDDGGPPYAAPGIAGLTSTLIAWQQGAPADGEVAVRYAQDGVTLAPAEVVSDPGDGPTDAAAGLFAAGDGLGDAVVAWVQGGAGARSIVAARLFEPPGQPAPAGGALVYVRTPLPVLSWSPVHEDWGPVSYAVTLDGRSLGQTAATSLATPSPLIDGPHAWQVGAANIAGGVTDSKPATVFVDTSPPGMRLELAGVPRAGSRLALHVSATDPPNPAQAGARASGPAGVLIRWGDGRSSRGLHGGAHAYARPGLYRVAVQVSDRAGNRTVLSRYVRILP
jgi:hypothetical protein